MMRNKFKDPNIVYTAKDVVRDVKTTLGVTNIYRTASRARSVAFASRCDSPDGVVCQSPHVLC
ncbi:hypothetical protein D8674_037432 [Pyrus ussuriensis x Pyrus communis]|uniref:Uncharacterized protein n=1 Tax=Pyrus ussuriensis x Pyrus communis TaxID=2448454 RepID=A0A5N5GW78_9ROSA|nr:hypothetical protein D8674_037432 [Pyrus ussuriensis x Pyrus communis]